MDDKNLGTSIIVLTIIIMFAYFIWAFSPYIGLSSWIPQQVSVWAFRLPVLLAIYIILGIILWIGWTMATTPPPLSLENPLDFERDRENTDSKESE